MIKGCFGCLTDLFKIGLGALIVFVGVYYFSNRSALVTIKNCYDGDNCTTTKGEKIRLACKNIVEQFPEYSNMVICVYDDSELGLELALGERSFINTKEQKIAWKALYAFNPVEGEYFDDNPNDYLGAN